MSKKKYDKGEYSNEDISEDWNKRISSEKALEAISVTYGDVLLPIIDPLLSVYNKYIRNYYKVIIICC